MVHTFNSSSGETEAGSSLELGSQPDPHRELQNSQSYTAEKSRLKKKKVIVTDAIEQISTQLFQESQSPLLASMSIRHVSGRQTTGKTPVHIK